MQTDSPLKSNIEYGYESGWSFTPLSGKRPKLKAWQDRPRETLDEALAWAEWVCLEHTGYARSKAEAWWRARSNEPVPDTVEEAVAVCYAGGIAPTQAVTVRSVAGEKFDRIVDYKLGAIPPRLDGGDERNANDPPRSDWPPDDCEVPF